MNEVFAMRAALPVLLATVLFATAMPAHADDVTQAKAKFQAAATAYREARYKEAIDLFIAANKLDPHPELIFNTGQAYEKLGDVPNALRAYREYLRIAPDVADRATVEESIKNLEQRLREKGVQQVTLFSNPSGATALLDGVAIGVTPSTFETKPGRHMVVLKATGYPDTAKEFVLSPDRAMDLDVSMAQVGSGSATMVGPSASASAGPAPSSTAPVVAPTADAPTQLGPVRPWTWAAFGVGVLGLGTAVGLEVARSGAESAARADPTQVGFKQKYDSMLSNQTGARVMAGIGAGFAAVGAVLLVVDLRAKPAAKPTTPAVSGPTLGLTCGPAGCGVFAAGRL
jgi:tetratricopeptide (TPR) repeat protein